MAFLTRLLVSVLVSVAAVTASPIDIGLDYATQQQFRLPGSKAAVASESKECSQIGKDLIAKGGNAADAMVGTTLCVGVMAPYHSGIGGGGFAMIRTATGQVQALDFREAAPAAAYTDMYRGNENGSIYGGLAVAIPGEMAGLDYIHRTFGLLSWRTVMQPAIDIARNGFAVNKDLIRYMEAAVAHSKDGNFLKDKASWAKDFAPKGELVKEGDIITRKRYADTLEKLALQGAVAFYSGSIAKSMVKTIQGNNGTMTEHDLAYYRATLRPVISTTYRDYKLYSIGTPAGGPVALNILKIMEGYSNGDESSQMWEEDRQVFEEGKSNHTSYANVTMHRYVEAMRFAYAARTQMGDPDFVDNMDKLTEQMLSSTKAKQIRKKIHDDHTLEIDEYAPGKYYAVENHGTSHIVTADETGLAITLTTTVNTLFGSQLMDKETGIILNNEMNDFSIPGKSNEFGFAPSPANYIISNKRPLSSIAPIIITSNNEDGKDTLFAATGAAGGSRIISATAQVVWRMLEFGMTMKRSVAEARLHDQLLPNTLLLEHAFDNQTASALRDKGHNLTWVAPGLSAVQGVRVLENGVFEAASEPRQLNSGAVTV